MTEPNILVSRFRYGWARNKDMRGPDVAHFYYREELSIARALCSPAVASKAGRLWEAGGAPHCPACSDLLAQGKSRRID